VSLTNCISSACCISISRTNILQMPTLQSTLPGTDTCLWSLCSFLHTNVKHCLLLVLPDLPMTGKNVLSIFPGGCHILLLRKISCFALP
jgi:hypothetical protein